MIWSANTNGTELDSLFVVKLQKKTFWTAVMYFQQRELVFCKWLWQLRYREWQKILRWFLWSVGVWENCFLLL